MHRRDRGRRLLHDASPGQPSSFCQTVDPVEGFMRTRWLVLPALVGLLMLGATAVSTQSEEGPQLATPVFHHVHQNSTDPAAAIAEFQKIYPALVKVTVGGFEGVQIPNIMSILFTKVNA